MPRGPKGQKRPADVIGNAVKVMRIATGELPKMTKTTARTPQPNPLGGAVAMRVPGL
jgi:hypothetical protein